MPLDPKHLEPPFIVPEPGQESAYEAVIMFAAWLTTREEVIEVGATADAAVIADLCEEFRVANNLPHPRNPHEHGFVHPS